MKLDPYFTPHTKNTPKSKCKRESSFLKNRGKKNYDSGLGNDFLKYILKYQSQEKIN